MMLLSNFSMGSRGREPFSAGLALGWEAGTER